MVISTTTALILGGLSAAGALGGASIASRSAGKAADAQAGAASQASRDQLEASKYSTDALLQASREANELQELMYLLGREDLAPWREVGGGALMTLQDLMQPEGYLAETYPEFQGEFQFDPSKVEADPGYEFRLQEGQKALERSAAARGHVLSGATLKELERYSQGVASDEYGRAYERQYGRSTDEYNRALEKYRTNFSVDQTNRGNLYNRLASLAGVGQTAVSDTAALGQGFATGAGRNLTDTAGNIASIQTGAQRAASDYATQAAAARASGYVGGANPWAQAIGQLSQLPVQYYTLKNLMNAGPYRI